MKFFENKFFLPTNLYGVDLDNNAQGFDRIRSFETIHLIFYVTATETVGFYSKSNRFNLFSTRLKKWESL